MDEPFDPTEVLEGAFWACLAACNSYSNDYVLSPEMHLSEAWIANKDKIRERNKPLYIYMKNLVAEVSAVKFIRFSAERIRNS